METRKLAAPREGGAPETQQNVVGGVVQVRNMIVEGASLLTQGPNPVTILATGDVEVRGLIDVSGHNAKNVATSNIGRSSGAFAPCARRATGCAAFTESSTR